jgi:hypothetical protein
MALSLPDPTFDDESTRRLYPTLPLFEGFPYLVTRVVPAMYHLILLPVTASELELVLLARTQWRANRLETCLVTGADRARFISADGRDALAQTPPRGGTLVTGCLKRARPFADTLELWARQHRLDAIVEACRRKDGYMFGDLTKGGARRDARRGRPTGRHGAGRAAPRPRVLPGVRGVARALSRSVPGVSVESHDGALPVPERQSLRGVRRDPLRTKIQCQLLPAERWAHLARARLL